MAELLREHALLKERVAELEEEAAAREESERQAAKRIAELADTNARLRDEIAEQEQANQEMRGVVRFLRDITDAMPLPFFVKDLKGRYLVVNAAASENIERPAEEIIGKTDLELFPTKVAQALRENDRRALASGELIVVEESLIVKEASQTVLVAKKVYRDDGGNAVGIIGASLNVTDRKRAEEERNLLMRRLLTAQEDERHRISRELHDHLGQYLAALMMGIKAIQRDAGLPAGLRERVVRLQELTTQFSAAVRHLALELRPTVLDDVGLKAALTNYVEEWSKLSGVRVDFHNSGLSKRRLPAQVETTLYRFVQEGLNNVLKHAQARRVSLIIERRAGRALAVLEDDGVGFDVAATLAVPVSERGLGLTGMRERVESVGGTLEIESAPGAGTTVVVRIPERESKCDVP